MKNLLTSALIFSIVLIVSSCAALRIGDLSRITPGMSKVQVREALQIKPDNTIAAERDPVDNSFIEVVQYSWPVSAEKMEYYWLYFVNDRLDKWHKVEPGSRWSDRRMDFRMRNN